MTSGCGFRTRNRHDAAFPLGEDRSVSESAVISPERMLSIPRRRLDPWTPVQPAGPYRQMTEARLHGIYPADRSMEEGRWAIRSIGDVSLRWITSGCPTIQDLGGYKRV
jgi:hypothetical protein